jgi:SpoVK/Ycf46/Vps4 family AAA+-type ATPase
MHKKIKPGHRVLFWGPPGTGKTLTATLLGKATKRDVYRIDLSKVVSKYIGETEKNLANVFDQAENKDWILFFDEADALFGKRTNVSNAHDRYANQEVSYLLQRIEDFPGVVILASNMKGNLDEAFTRRFQAMIHFPMPNFQERFRLWENSFSKHSSLEDDIDLNRIAENYEMTGGSVINVVRYSSLEALRRKSTEILMTDLEAGIRKELLKEGKTV